ncbi:MAG: dihydroneopterin aldolase [Armatimonadota bacterium]|nr:dihydroneopterin aldolase [Armatimonadota bacterium]MDR7485284.1 dihydroneopterin aldolase [Armatimonadota bacterium]MDR7533878.1 dihydroneopterin aldolase [Armatimonadota bacterium]MDR7537160.1 dihydroneopterin aldolase [Armatimonadota bacterium]
MHKILLHGMRFMGCHGVDPEEQIRPQAFVVDLEVEGDFSEAALQDELSLTVDYRELYAVCRHTVEEERFQLLEALSEAIAAKILRLARVDGVTVRVRKPQVRLGGPLDAAAVEITRRRKG